MIYKQTPTTFLVSEELFYEPSGQGPHTFGFFEKRAIPTMVLKKDVAKQLQVPVKEIHHAGLKDTQSTAKQWLSWPGDQVPALGGASWDLLETKCHENALKIGHIVRNRFQLIFEQKPAFQRNVEAAFPNFFGPQRTEINLDNMQKYLKRKVSAFEVSSVQAQLFNALLLQRLRDHKAEPKPGELWKHRASKKTFVEQDFELASERFGAGEISPTGPMFGPKMPQPEHGLELDFLTGLGFQVDDFKVWGKRGRGARRALWVTPEDPQLQEMEDGSWALSFALPSGSYASVYLFWLIGLDLGEGDLPVWPSLLDGVTVPEACGLKGSPQDSLADG